MTRRATPKEGKVNNRRSPARRPPKTDDPRVRALEARLTEALQGRAEALERLQTRDRELTEAREQQTATAEVLRLINQSPTGTRPVFEGIARSAAHLCQAVMALVVLREGDELHIGAVFAEPEVRGDFGWQASYPRPLDRSGIFGRVIRERSPVAVEDTECDPRLSMGAVAAARRGQYRRFLVVPMLREGEAIGLVTIAGAEPGPFSAAQIAVLETFAAQAVIAIENVRLFNETKEALERQTATAEILRVISSSPTDVQPVFDAITENAARLCGVADGWIVLAEGDTLRGVSAVGHLVWQLPVYNARRVPLTRESVVGRAILDGTTIHIDDLAAASEAEYPHGRALQRMLGHRTQLVTPLLREGVAIGAILLARFEVRLFSERQIELLKTFADQAVIAIENVRLFKELQASNRELSTALDKQTATSDILRVISHSQTDVQPVFNSILLSAIRLLGAYAGALTRIADGQIELAALTRTDHEGEAAVRAAFPQSLQSDWPHARAIRDRAPLNIADAQTDPRIPEAEHVRARVRGFRSRIVVPILRQDEAVGAISVSRREPGGFKDDEIALLQTFADQAGIAIENARVLSELQARTAELTRSVEQLTALGEVGRAVSSTLDLETVLTTIVARAVQLSGLDGGVVFEYDKGPEEFVQRVATEAGRALAEARRTTRIRKGEGVLGQTAITLEPVQVPDITVPGAYAGRLRDPLIGSGVRAILAVPMVREGELIGCLGVTRNRPGEFAAETIDLLRTFATQSALAIQNARLFREIADKSRQLEAASRHKSEFLANMSHELRTPLNAVIGFSEVLLQRMFGDLNAKQDEYLKDIHSSGQHLLSLINDILDLSKIEAGRMELAPAPFHLPSALDYAVTLVKERAARHGIALVLDLDPRLGDIVGDERKVKQVLLNLLSNAVKFTPEGGRIALKAGQKGGAVEIAVTDTGVGIAPEDQAAIFEEFRQVGHDETRKQEGTGLGLTLARKFVELHGGRIWVESQPGRGSTFTFTLPAR
jgi:signal transduction histidine kinase